jgi:uncharacterized protein with FMN-binding domain
MASKMPRHLVALSSSAIAAIYFAGFVATRSADAGLSADPASATEPDTRVAAPSPGAASQPTPVVSASAPRRGNRGAGATLPARPPASTAPSASTPPTAGTGPGTSAASGASTSPGGAAAPATSSAPTTQAATYRDGTYTGSGTSRRGGVGVQLTIQDSHISNVTITRVTTQYPVSRIASLPAQVIARQSAQVDRISGATYSVQAFQQAVQQALSSARA